MKYVWDKKRRYINTDYVREYIIKDYIDWDTLKDQEDIDIQDSDDVTEETKNKYRYYTVEAVFSGEDGKYLQDVELGKFDCLQDAHQFVERTIRG
jgi:hypothetical protein